MMMPASHCLQEQLARSRLWNKRKGKFSLIFHISVAILVVKVGSAPSLPVETLYTRHHHQVRVTDVVTSKLNSQEGEDR